MNSAISCVVSSGTFNFVSPGTAQRGRGGPAVGEVVVADAFTDSDRADQSGLVRREHVGDGRGHLGGVQGGRGRVVRPLLDEVADHVGPHETGADGMDPHPQLGELGGGAANEADNGRFGRGIERIFEEWVQSGCGRRGHDGAAHGQRHDRDHLRRRQDHPVEIDTHKPPVVGDGHVENPARVGHGHDSGIEVGEVDPTERGRDIGEQAIPALRLGDVHDHRGGADLIGHRPQSGITHVDGYDVCSKSAKAAR